MAAEQSQTPGVTVVCPIRWGDMDSLGHVNNIIYFQYCESARMAYFEALGLRNFQRQPTDGPGMVAANLNFRRQLRYPGTVHVTANVTQIKDRSFTLSYRLVDAEDGAVVADGASVCVWVDYAAGKALPLPTAMVDRMIELEQNPGLRGAPAD
ncbi:MAG: acyl-CoA thioesterase [Pirellulales bacterium]|nr:acyl-CoA thioesterase [Pirellulales bacterium]